MTTRPGPIRAIAAAAAIGVLLAAAGCGGRVKQEEFDAEVTRLREEMKSGDQGLSGRVDSTNQAVTDHARRLDALEQELSAFRAEYNVSIEKLKGMLRFNMPIHFAFGSSELREADRPVLDKFAAVVKQYYPGAVITVEGLTDPAGSAAYNRALGLRRAEAVKHYLATAGGFTSETLKAVSYGEARSRQVVPGAKGPGDSGIENRRVVLVIDHAAIAADQAVLP